MAMLKRVLVLLSILLLTTTLAFANGDVPSFSTDSVDVECPVACKCCDDLTGGLLEDVDYYNELLEGYESETLSYGFDWSSIKTLLDEKAAGAQRSQSPIDSISKAGHRDWKKDYAEAQEVEEVMEAVFEEGDDICQDLTTINKDLQDTINKILDCDCIEGCKTGLMSLLGRLQSDAETKIPELKKQQGLWKLNALATAFNFDQAGADRADAAKKAAEDALKEFSPIDPKPMELVADCCKKGVDECVDDIWEGVIHYPLDWLVGGWGIDASLEGRDVATGNFGDLTLTNNTGEKVGWIIQAGTVLYPGSGDTQRMTVTETLKGVLEPGQTVTVPVEGACVDSGLFPPSSGIPDLGISFGGLVPSLSFLSDFPSISSMVSDIFAPFEEALANIANYGSTYSTPESPGFSFIDLINRLGDMFGGDIFSEYVADLISIPSFFDIVGSFIGSDEYVPTGLPFEMDLSTIGQWATWDATDGFDSQDGEERIADQVNETGGSQTPAQISTLNTNIWSNVNLVQKQARAQVAGAGAGIGGSRGSKIEKRKLNIDLAWVRKAIEQFNFVQEVQAQQVPSKEDYFGQALKAVRTSSYILSMIQNLVFDLEKISKLSFANDVSELSEGKTKAIRKRLTSVLKDSRKSKVKFSKTKELSADDFMKIRDAKVALMEKGKDYNRLFETIREQINESYKAWDKKYVKLAKKYKKAKDKGKDFEAVLNREQIKFVKVFTRVKMYYKILERLYK